MLTGFVSVTTEYQQASDIFMGIFSLLQIYQVMIP